MCHYPYDMAYWGSMTLLLKEKRETPPLPVFSDPDLCSLIKPGTGMRFKDRPLQSSPLKCSFTQKGSTWENKCYPVPSEGLFPGKHTERHCGYSLSGRLTPPPTPTALGQFAVQLLNPENSRSEPNTIQSLGKMVSCSRSLSFLLPSVSLLLM